jgi:hypothetical protein
MQNKKIFILLPDGVGLRNFAFTNFYTIGIDKGFEVVFWNNTIFDLKKLALPSININQAKIHPLTNFYKKAQTHIELNLNILKSKDEVYNFYRFPVSYENWKMIIKNAFTRWLIFWNNSEKGLFSIRKRIVKYERKTKYYYDSLETLRIEKPAMVFCTNQRTVNSVAPILAAQDLGIPTATFIFSWDNLPKATKIIETDFYFVWSVHMKKELMFYYPYINENQIRITGTPQFETHFDSSYLRSKDVFFKEHHLDLSKKYICFSGDDITTSPNDPIYLADTAKAIRNLNKTGLNLGIIFRRCPVDFSDRFDSVLTEYSDIIKTINPKWDKIENAWNTVLPTKEDLALQMNTIFHTEMVFNLGSSMVFDYVTQNKPCAYFNYDIPDSIAKDWSVSKIYKFVHFKSMPNKDSVLWINNPNDIEKRIEKVLNNEADEVIQNAQKWFEIINQHPPEKASERIWNAIIAICDEQNG